MDSTFQPDWVSPPGDTIAMILEQRRVERQELAEALGKSVDDVSKLISGALAVDASLARGLSQVLGSTEEFWLSREAGYQDALKRFRERARPSEHVGWLSEIPTAEVFAFAKIDPSLPKADQVTALLRFFAVPTVQEWKNVYVDDVRNAIAYRTSQAFDSNPGAIAAWLRLCEIAAGEIACKPWKRESFEARLNEIRRLTLVKRPVDFIPQLQAICADCGVAVVVVKAPKGCRASGATRFLSPDRPLLMLSGRHLSDDHFWFSFFHEAGHLILHGDRLFLELENDDMASSKEEAEANAFAESVLIPERFRSAFEQLRIDLRDIMRFARDAGISYGIVVGQLQHYGRVRRNHFNNLKQRYAWQPKD